jgi:hypothetical protein
MSKSLRLLLALIVSMVLGLSALPAQASYTGTTPNTACDGDANISKCPSNNAVVKFLNGVPCPAKGKAPPRVRASVYSLTVPQVYSAYERIIKCGVDVEIVWAKQIKDGKKVGNSYWMDKLVHLKGPKTKIKEVTASGMATGTKGTQHIKLITRSTDNGVITGSNNTSYAGDRDAWGGWYQISDKLIHDRSVKLIEASMKDKKQSACSYSGKGTDVRRAMYYQPCSFDPVLDILKHSHAGNGCVWYYQMFMVTSYAKVKVAELKRLGREGCHIYVLVNYGGTWTMSIMRDLSKSKNVQINDASYDPKHPNDHIYNHAKRNAAKGLNRSGKAYSFISDGSATDTGEGYESSVNNLLVSTVPEEIQAGLNWADLAQSKSRQLTYAVLCKNKKLSGC